MRVVGGGGSCQAWEHLQFLFVDGSVMESGVAMEGMVLVSVRAWLLGRAVVNLPTHCRKCVV